MSFDRSKAIAVLTGIVSLVLGIAYLILVQVLDSRGEMIPAPTGTMTRSISIVHSQPQLKDVLIL
ncbi:hypothetical protein C1752_06630 [Acaryochloris thomasi RCC1774]|uniref:Glucose-inhibited division protein A n=1 Tax=Acaryochloris thomasi RCC1774 TaxID=1764569 RepID=A0A2W1JQ37_9CYAN|nr:hypothetical protein [Acaryochloris thomasi]PZD71351.1 hypothetical protein C1752_06630 [Acaryochloris thomasi RCC1774]